ncbi:hypothetical protein P691DRAFT_657087 [Macrolepiota fuliginosa MF-IS2]|uniref:DASH complex subunit DAD2 n=1 Tax=Macrolepiota fuliginosa MF-IS2 TaxID=1400762 RepID=A0A9P5XRC0_9AGAR|nr:hypothetical protein P691DRAFT_657087 [Macrolepiota fuliginosa MF-IS2]
MSIRQSSIPARASYAPSQSSQGANSAAMAKLLEKKKEYDAVAALEKASTLYLQRIEALGEDCEIMAKAGEVHGQVLEQWPRMFQILSLFLASREKQDDDDASEGQRLVRLPIDELQQQTSEQS